MTVSGRPVVVVILAVFFMALLGYAGMYVFIGDDMKTAIEDQTPFDLKDLWVGVQRYKRDLGTLPPEVPGLEVLVTDARIPGWRGPYYGRSLIDPWGAEYRYRIDSLEDETFTLYSIGPDGEDGTADDIVFVPEQEDV